MQPSLTPLTGALAASARAASKEERCGSDPSRSQRMVSSIDSSACGARVSSKRASPWLTSTGDGEKRRRVRRVTPSSPR